MRITRPGSLELSAHLPYLPQAVGIVLSLKANISKVGYIALMVKHDNRNGVVAVDNLEHQRQVCVFICLTQRAHSLCPHFHVVTFFYFKVACQEVGYSQRGYRYEDSRGYQEYLYLSDSVSPLHINITLCTANLLPSALMQYHLMTIHNVYTVMRWLILQHTTVKSEIRFSRAEGALT